MPSLADIARSTQTVPVGVPPQPVSVYGISAKGIAVLVERFPIIRELFTEEDAPTIDAATIMKLVPESLACVIACGTGAPGNLEMEEVASNLSASDQADLLEKILELTMPKGVGPFMEKVMRIVESMAVEEKFTKARDMKLQAPSSP